MVYVDKQGKIEWFFVHNREHVLDRTNAEWLTEELEEIITMHKLGGFRSRIEPNNYGINSCQTIWRHKSSLRRKKR